MLGTQFLWTTWRPNMEWFFDCCQRHQRGQQLFRSHWGRSNYYWRLAYVRIEVEQSGILLGKK
jgi:hypothetical protein